VDDFRERAFIPERPILITRGDDYEQDSTNFQPSSFIPAANKWFGLAGKGSTSKFHGITPSRQYLSPFGDVVLPYELIVGQSQSELYSRKESLQPELHKGQGEGVEAILSQLTKGSPPGTFHRFNAPLSLFLEACTARRSSYQLYIAQAQISDLPKELQDDLPTPRLVKEAGKGDVYDANIWMGIPPTYTPLHKDPNPNLFVQLASRKQVRLFRPVIGASIFRDVQMRIRQTSSPNFRGEEMMAGPEREVLDELVWGPSAIRDGLQAILGPGDALFIPKGWWHSIKSVGTDVTASVNWWFR